MLVIFSLFQIWPVIKLFILSLQNWSDVLAGRGNSWTLNNYQHLLKDPVFWKVLKNTIVFTLIRVPLGLVIGLLIATAINRTIRLRGWYIGAFYSPIITSVVAMALVFSYFYHPVFGLFNYILSQLGLPTQKFLSDPKQALYCIILVDLWKSIGFEIIIFLAGLQAIPEEYYEATALEGANSFQSFWKITFPLLAPTTYLLIITDVISTMRIFPWACHRRRRGRARGMPCSPASIAATSSRSQ
jgi:multiple sugar transport system permease protein